MPLERLSHCDWCVEASPHSGLVNMQRDESLLNRAINGATAFVRWYRWSEATVSLGYFQPDSPFEANSPLTALPKVRRLSGGGALVHHWEWTYACVLPPNQRLVLRPHELYVQMHSVIVSVLSEMGYDVAPRGSTHRGAAEPSLCFAREDENDLVLDGHKVLGSAQRRRRGALLQHGGLLIQRSPWTPNFPGIQDLRPLAAAVDAAAIRRLAVDMANSLALASCEVSELAHEVPAG